MFLQGASEPLGTTGTSTATGLETGTVVVAATIAGGTKEHTLWPFGPAPLYLFVFFFAFFCLFYCYLRKAKTCSNCWPFLNNKSV